MEKRVVRTERAPAPFRGAPYSQAIAFGDLVFVAGQVGLAAGSSELAGETIEEQTEQACENVRAILEAAGTSFEKVVQTTVYLVDFADFEGMYAVVARYVGMVADTARGYVTVEGLAGGMHGECVY